jgi:hypothetical protein
MSKRSVTATVWVVAFFVTVALALFQRMTGPSHPKRGVARVSGSDELRYRLPRTHGGDGGLEIAIAAPDVVDAGVVEWRRYPTAEPWSDLAMTRDFRGRLTATLPHQPPAGKVEYRVLLEADGTRIELPGGEPVVARFRAGVPAGVLVPHILAMFAGMLLATRALLEVLRPSAPSPRKLVVAAMALLVAGGLFLGPVVQKFAFGAYWTGWPFGHDLTDNKTLVAFLAWLPATFLALRGRRTRAAVIIGWIVMMGVFLIPHSLRGSEVDWSEAEVRTGSASVRVIPGDDRVRLAG